MHSDEEMAKDFTNMTHAERMAALYADTQSPACVAKADKLLDLIKHEWLDALAVRERLASRHGNSAPAPTMPIAVAPAAVSPTAQVAAPSEQAPVATFAELVKAYRTHEKSPFHVIRFRTRTNYDNMLRRIEQDHGSKKLADIQAQDLDGFFEDWKQGGSRVGMAHALITMLRGLFSFGWKTLEDPGCERLSVLMHGMRFRVVRSKSVRMTEEHALAIIEEAHKQGFHSIAVAQAIQFYFELGQRDTIGEWVPLDEPGDSKIVDGGMKWLRGLRWERIDNEFIRHVTSNGDKSLRFRLSKAPRVAAELELYGRRQSGPVIVHEATGFPYTSSHFRLIWRKIATAAGVPKEVKNGRGGTVESEEDGDEVTPPASELDLGTEIEAAQTTRH